MTDQTIEIAQDPNDEESRHSRRRLLKRAAGGAGLLSSAGSGAFSLHRATAKDDDDDDDDNSGHGGGAAATKTTPGPAHGGGDDAPVITGEIPPGSIEVRIVDDDANGFSPGELTVDAGQSVTFVNADHHTHTATGSGFDTGLIQPGGTATVVLTNPGHFAYACQIHPQMTGTIGVRDEHGEVPEPVQASPPTTPHATAATPAASPSAASAASDNLLVTILDFSFDPATLEIPAGTTVTWLNDGNAPHTATAQNGTFDTGRLDPGQEGSFSFDRPGTYNYACSFHPQMVGAVIVG